MLHGPWKKGKEENAVREMWQKGRHKTWRIRMHCTVAGSETQVATCKDQREASRRQGWFPADSQQSKTGHQVYGSIHLNSADSLNEPRNAFSPRAFRRKCSPAGSLISTLWDFEQRNQLSLTVPGLLTHREKWEQMCCFKLLKLW